MRAVCAWPQDPERTRHVNPGWPRDQMPRSSSASLSFRRVPSSSTGHAEPGNGPAARGGLEIRAERARMLDAALVASADRSRLLGLARELCQGRESFANHVLVARRQGLIAEAAAILTELSSGRLTFAEDVAATFSVLDTGTA